jgi:hypothetical protein
LRLVKESGGICIDLSHLKHFENFYPDYFLLTKKAADNYRIGCNHLSAILANGKSWHKVKKFSDLDYLKTIPKKYFSEYICLEMANPVKEQLKFKKYIAKILAESWRG